LSEARPSAVLHQTLIGAGALVVGAAMAWGASEIPSQAGYAGVGPNFLPWVVSVVLMVCGAWLVYEARTGGWRAMEPAPGAERGDWVSLAWVVAGVVVNALLITTIGFILACTLCFMLAVRGLRAAEGKGHGGTKGLVIDFITGFLIAAPAFWLFTLVLGINLPNITGTGWL
jgi:putative tricarboxylic transport membrane protein